QNAAPTVIVIAPAAPVVLVVGRIVTIGYRDDDVDDVAVTEVLADVDGDLATAADQVVIATGRAEADGALQAVDWDTTGTPAAVYRIFVRTEDASHPPVVAEAAGTVDVRRVPPAAIVFPTPNARTDTGALTVTGTVDAGVDVVAVRVNGAPAATTNGFRTWRAEVALLAGANDLRLELESSTGAIDRDFVPVRVVRGLSLVSPIGIAVAPAGNRAYVLDSQTFSLVALDMSTSMLTVTSGNARGAGPAFAGPAGLTVDPGTGRALVLDNRRLFDVDLVSGDRALLSGDGRGAGTDFSVPRVVAADGAGTAFVLDAALFAVFSVSLVTGDRTIVSDADTGLGDLITQPRGVAVEPGGARLFALSASPATIYAVDLASGDRTVLSSALVGFGPRLGFGAGLAADFPGARLFALNQADGTLLEVALTSGDRELVSDQFEPGPALTSAAAIDLDATHGRVLDADPVLDAVVGVDLATGARMVVASTAAGAGPPALGAGVLAVDPGRRRTFATGLAVSGVFAIDHDTGARNVLGAGSGVQCLLHDAIGDRLLSGTSSGTVVAIDPDDGSKSNVSGPGVGAGPALGSVTALALHPFATRLYVFDATLDAVLVVDLATGDRSILADAGTGTGPVPRAVFGMAFDTVNDRLLLADDQDNAILAVDLTTGDRTVVSDATHAGPDLVTLRGVALDAANNRLLVADQGQRMILAVNLTTGARTELTGATRGRGTLPSGPEGVDYDAVRGLVVFVDVRIGGVLLVDPVSGDRVVQSR
ncbi:MAG: hypothetical protein OER88_03705, partial [Planctomycetota bacterium]|nr:hypothetical protein [Planctomycetota bacterium]